MTTLYPGYISIKRYNELKLAACCVANAIECGAGGMIKGTLMEKELRDALGLMPGEFVPIPKENDECAPTR